ncbi:gamma-glutamyl-gamma-aminobutyrate hydrolase family protein [Aquisalimonas lutea]|uniref:gamma-glutamyl-gamma-aminobutyrate hydrolase family protein n=1 Tax=Aquisalimonas lutea TaxID=1327750 RepID=UPI0025B531C8|nr:gamma-glutamyl-gamma-aminobutyrate hydrolase family protein [Aquisalimonas lutea]MDN3517317.1 gamma-glutamyl-gamma-aminobutyrate hydrolase family protein [Aquisalimonas lutea]
MRPVIGVTGPNRGGEAAWLCTRLAVRRAGGRAVRITPARPLAVEALDGLIIGGGADVDPGLYGEEPEHPGFRALRRSSRNLPRFLVTLALFPLLWALRRLLSTRDTLAADTDRDALEMRLLTRALERELPVLGICRGAQLLNVIRGGSLYQSLEAFYSESPNLWTIWPQKPVRITPSSRLAAALERTYCYVNSLHRQAIRTPAPGLEVVAREDSGVIQAIEDPNAPCVVGVQWHPEYLPQKREQRALFRQLVRVAADTFHARSTP